MRSALSCPQKTTLTTYSPLLTMPTATIYNTHEVAEIISKRILPSNAKPLSHRSVARICKAGGFEGAYMAQGDWCITDEAVEVFIAHALSSRSGRNLKKNNKEQL